MQNRKHKCVLCGESEKNVKLQKYSNNSIYKNLLKHLQIVQKHGLFKGKYDELHLALDPQDYYYHSECHKQIIRVKESDVKTKTRAADIDKRAKGNNGLEDDIQMQAETPPFPDQHDHQNSEESDEDIPDDYDDPDDEDWIPDDQVDAR